MRNPKFHSLLTKMGEVHDAKNHDYASDSNPYSNFEFAANFAGISVDQVFAVLIGVKQARLKELTSSAKTPNHESISDTKLDLAVYSALRASYDETPDTQVAMPDLSTVGNRALDAAVYDLRVLRERQALKDNLKTPPQGPCFHYEGGTGIGICRFCGFPQEAHPWYQNCTGNSTDPTFHP